MITSGYRRRRPHSIRTIPRRVALLNVPRTRSTAGRFGEAHQLLAQARQAQIAAAQEALKLRDKAQAAADAQLLGAAASTATEGGVAMTERHYVEAADLFKQAAALVPEGHSGETSGYLERQEDALYHQGDELGDNRRFSIRYRYGKR